MTPSADRPVVLVGAGKMGGAMLDGWLARGLPPAALLAVDPACEAESRARWEAAGVTVADAVPESLSAGVLLMAVKPQVMAEVMPAVRGARAADTVVVSVAAGITVATLEAGLGAGPVIRTIPNTPSQIGKGVTVAVANGAAGGAARAAATELLSAIGTVHFVEDEGLIDAATAVSGSGPAYVFHMAEALAAAGAAAGLPETLATAIARETIAGAAALMEETGLPAGTLRRNVTSPNGTTQAALDVLMADPGLTDLMTRAVAAATRRSRELGS